MIGASACGPMGYVWWSQCGPRRGRRWRQREWWAGAMDDRPHRAERGEVRLLVLDAIKDQPRHGYEIIQHIETRAGGSYRPSPGVIYPTLQLLEELEQAQVVEQAGRKAYVITDAGRNELTANRRAVDDFYDRFEEEPWEAYAEDFAEVMQGVARLVKAFRRGSQRGRMSPATLRAIKTALDEALDKIEAALGGRSR